MRVRHRILFALSLLVSSFAAVPEVRAAFPGDNGLIAYARVTQTATAPDGIMTMNPDGTGQKLFLDTGLGGESAPEWSADAARIVFEQGGDIFVANANGAGIVRNLTNSPEQDAAPTWSPDGTRIAYASTDPTTNDSNLFVMGSDGSNNTRLTTNPRWDGYPSWSPDGTSIAYTSDEGPGLNFGLFTIPSAGGTPSFVTETTVINALHDWSPDGSRIAFHNVNEVWLVDPSGANLTQVTTNGRVFFGIAFSPDGTKIAFRTDRTGNGEIFAINVDGSDPVNLTNTPTVDERFPSWAPAAPPVPGCEPGGGTTCGTEGDDSLQVTIDGTSESYVVETGGGSDTVELHIDDPTSPATVTIDTGDGGDTVIVPPSSGQVSVRVETGLGNDVVRPRAGTATPRIAAQQAGARGYVVLTAGGNDRVKTGPAGDTVDGGAGKDDVDGGGGADRLGGGGGGDAIEGGPGSDEMNGGGGTDVLHGSDGKNLFNGGSGSDTCLSDTKLDRFRSCERVRRNHRRNHQQV